MGLCPDEPVRPDQSDAFGKVVVIVDDGVATGSTARAACDVARTEGAAQVVLAVPVAPTDWISRLSAAADVFVAVVTPTDYHAVGQFYRDFTQTRDDQVVQLLDEAATRIVTTRRSTADRPSDDRRCSTTT